MKALISDRYGGVEVMRVGELPAPRPRRGEALVEVKAAAVNPVDYKVRAGDFRWLRPLSFPLVLGGDLSGVVREVGPGVTGLVVGQAVYGCRSWLSRRPGSHAEQVCLPARALRAIPQGLDFVQAAALPCAALTAIAGLRKCRALSGKTVAVNGATGGVGHFAVQIARAWGAGRVIGVCSSRNRDLAKELGADEVLDHQAGGVTAGDGRYTVLFDAYGHLSSRDALRTLEPRGVFCTTLPSPAVIGAAAWRRLWGGKRIAFANMDTSAPIYEELERLIAAGQVRPRVERVFNLDDGVAAFRALEGGGVRGKVVIAMA